ncbi:hypothetical protein OROHE_012974 [Orobanche hederae]
MGESDEPSTTFSFFPNYRSVFVKMLDQHMVKSFHPRLLRNIVRAMKHGHSPEAMYPIPHESDTPDMRSTCCCHHGLQVKQLPTGIFINQEKYSKELLNKFGMQLQILVNSHEHFHAD